METSCVRLFARSRAKICTKGRPPAGAGYVTPVTRLRARLANTTKRPSAEGRAVEQSSLPALVLAALTLTRLRDRVATLNSRTFCVAAAFAGSPVGLSVTPV